jgi:hypothetical protein
MKSVSQELENQLRAIFERVTMEWMEIVKNGYPHDGIPATMTKPFIYSNSLEIEGIK